MKKTDILAYEVRASWWAGYLSANWMQKLAARYFVWKVERKYARYKKSMELFNKVTQSAINQTVEILSYD